MDSRIILCLIILVIFAMIVSKGKKENFSNNPNYNSGINPATFEVGLMGCSPKMSNLCTQNRLYPPKNAEVDYGNTFPKCNDASCFQFIQSP